LQYSDADYFNLSEKDVRVATAKREQVGPTVEQVKHVIAIVPADSEIQRRDRALIAFTLLTGARDSAIASMKLKHVNLAAGCVEQDAREVQTKFSKTFSTYFFPVGDEIRRIVEEWIGFLREEMLWGNDDPLFPATRIALGPSRQFEAVGLERAHWSSAARIRTIFRDAFVSAGLPYFNPHSFRNTLVRLGQSVCQTPEEFKAWSQNLGHEKVLTTFLSYGKVESPRQGEIIRGLASPPLATQPDVSELARALVREMQVSGVGTVVK
jgi:integrase